MATAQCQERRDESQSARSGGSAGLKGNNFDEIVERCDCNKAAAASEEEGPNEK